VKTRSIATVSAVLVMKLRRLLELAHPRDDGADRPRQEERDRQALQVPVELRAELHVDAARGVREEIGA